jgi:site-specific recombinase XerD
MAKIFDRKITSTTLAERKEGIKHVRATLKGRRLKRFNEATEAQQLAFVDKLLKKHGRRDKAGAIDWVALKDFIKFIFELLAPFLFPTT